MDKSYTVKQLNQARGRLGAAGIEGLVRTWGSVRVEIRDGEDSSRIPLAAYQRALDMNSIKGVTLVRSKLDPLTGSLGELTVYPSKLARQGGQRKVVGE